MTVTIHGSEAATRGVLKKLCSQKFRKNQRKTPVPVTLFFLSLWHRRFPVNFAKFLRIPLLQNTPGRLLLKDLKFSALVNIEESMFIGF